MICQSGPNVCCGSRSVASGGDFRHYPERGHSLALRHVSSWPIVDVSKECADPGAVDDYLTDGSEPSNSSATSGLISFCLRDIGCCGFGVTLFQQSHAASIERQRILCIKSHYVFEISECEVVFTFVGIGQRTIIKRGGKIATLQPNRLIVIRNGPIVIALDPVNDSTVVVWVSGAGIEADRLIVILQSAAILALSPIGDSSIVERQWPIVEVGPG
jgi:hypothetical protein